MKQFLSWALPSFVASFTALAAITSLPTSIDNSISLPFVPNKFIVEFDEDSGFLTKRAFERRHDGLYSILRERQVAFNVDIEYDEPGLFVGAALTIENEAHAESLANTQGIKAIRPVVRIDAPKPAFARPADGPSLPDGIPAQHKMTGVDKLHAEGITGKGVKIGIIDSGVDYNHPNLGGGFGPGKKFVGGHDFVGDEFNGTSELKPDDDPLDECNGHGSHVAGIIGASGPNQWNVTGVAPDATFYSYRVFGCLGFVTDAIIVQALLRAVKDGVDVINISIGGRDGWTRATGSVVASRIAATGKVIAIAAGNEGLSGAFYSSGPANAIDAISVASVENLIYPLQTVNVIGAEHEPILYFAWLPFNVTDDLPLYTLTNDTKVEDDGCSELPDDTPDLSKFVVLVRRGTCPFQTKVDNLVKKNATQALFYDNGTNFLGIQVGNFTGALIKAEDGEFLVKQYAAGVRVTLDFPQAGGVIEYPAQWGGLTSNFSSYGPTNDFYFKPSIAAPGSNILSTIPLEMDGFAVVSGTSMSTPFIAGSAALVLSVKGVTPQVGLATRDLLESTANYVPSKPADGSLLQTAIQQGAGLVNVFRAIHTTTIISPAELVLNDTSYFNPIHKVTVNNTANSEKAYKLKHVPAGTAQTITPNTIFPANGPVPLTGAQAVVQMSPDSFTLGPNESKEVTLTFALPPGVDPKTFPIFSGFIEFDDGSDVGPVHASYIGAGASMKDIQVVDNTDWYFGAKLPLITNSTGHIQDTAQNYTFVNNTPILYWRQTFGTPLFRLDVVHANTTIKPTLNRRQADEGQGHIFTFPSEDGEVSSVQIAGPLYQIEYLPRNNDNPNDYGYNALVWVLPEYANGTRIEPGNYRILLRALKMTGDASKDEDYESWLSPVIGVYSELPPKPEEPETPGEPEDPEAPEEPEDPETPEDPEESEGLEASKE
ncbi:pyrolysin [Coprinopsis sp. MPI-PUGE-AT-0042]|nr:pyrolysin [Coprinopsis sp. MPI-PUGE-AT-0042]